MEQYPLGKPSTRISRRDLLKKGAALGGAVVWVTPAVQTLGMGRAFASTASPAERLSFLVLNVSCSEGQFNVKYEFDENDYVEPGSGCESVYTPVGSKAIGDEDLGLSPPSVIVDGAGCYKVKLNGDGCTLLGGAAKAGTVCVGFGADGQFCLGV